MNLSSEEILHYEARGYLVRHSVFSKDEITGLRHAIERAETNARHLSATGKTYFLDGKRFVDSQGSTLQYEHEAQSEDLRVIEPIHIFDTEIDALLDDPRLVQPMQTIIGCRDLSLWTGKLNLKPGGGSGFGWHQDSPYWIHDCQHVDQLPNVMVTLDDQDESNGCFRVIAGSHKQSILPGHNNGTQLGGFFTDPSAFNMADQVAMKVPAGSLVFFNPHIVHGSAPNMSTLPRRALIFTYQPGNQPLLKTGEVRNIANTIT